MFKSYREEGHCISHPWQIPEVSSDCTAQISSAREPISLMVVAGSVY